MLDWFYVSEWFPALIFFLVTIIILLILQKKTSINFEKKRLEFEYQQKANSHAVNTIRVSVKDALIILSEKYKKIEEKIKNLEKN